MSTICYVLLTGSSKKTQLAMSCLCRPKILKDFACLAKVISRRYLVISCHALPVNRIALSNVRNNPELRRIIHLTGQIGGRSGLIALSDQFSKDQAVWKHCGDIKQSFENSEEGSPPRPLFGCSSFGSGSGEGKLLCPEVLAPLKGLPNVSFHLSIPQSSPRSSA